jgi:hypothetical protein
VARRDRAAGRARAAGRSAEGVVSVNGARVKPSETPPRRRSPLELAHSATLSPCRTVPSPSPSRARRGPLRPGAPRMRSPTGANRCAPSSAPPLVSWPRYLPWQPREKLGADSGRLDDGLRRPASAPRRPGSETGGPGEALPRGVRYRLPGPEP